MTSFHAIFPRGLVGPGLLLVLFAVLGCAGNPPQPGPEGHPAPAVDLGIDRAALPDSVPDLPGFTGRIYRDGRVYLGGQPDRKALALLPDHGITTVINLRTPKEMADTAQVAFDQAALVDSLGLTEIRIPLGGKAHPYTPAAVDTFAAVVARHDGGILVHCRSGGRVSHLWAAYLVRHHGWDVSTAYARGEAVGIGRSAFSKLIDRKLKVVPDDS